MPSTSTKTVQEIENQTLDEVNNARRVNLVAGTITGADGSILDGVSSSIKATVKDLVNSNPLTTAIVDANGDQITSFGGGTQYNDGSARGSATGTLVLVDDGVNVQSWAGDSSGHGLVKVGVDEIVPTQITKTIAATGTPEAIAGNGTFFQSALVMGKKAARTNNIGVVYLGIGGTNDTQPFDLNPGEVITINAPVSKKFDLNDWYVDVLNAGDGVVVIYS